MPEEFHEICCLSESEGGCDYFDGLVGVGEDPFGLECDALLDQRFGRLSGDGEAGTIEGFFGRAELTSESSDGTMLGVDAVEQCFEVLK